MSAQNQTLNNYQQKVLDLNKGKKVQYVSLEGIGEGYIQDLRYEFGSLNYIVSKAKNPKGKFNFENGRWAIVEPLRIVNLSNA